MKMNDESAGEEEIQKTIATLINWNPFEEREIGTKSNFIPSLPDTVLAPQTQIMYEDISSFSGMENPVINETSTTR